MGIRSWDDDSLMAALQESVRAARAVPAEFVEAAKAAYAWHNIDAELATLTYDSAASDSPALVRSRGESASLRDMTFTSADVTIEVEVTPDALIGQIVPPRPGELEVRDATSTVATATIDDLGFFIIRPVPAGEFRLHFRPVEGGSVLTGWIFL